MTQTLRFLLNGEVHEVTDVDPHTTLLQYLRQSGLTGTKEGCAEGECGACAVVVREGDSQAEGHYEAVNACLLLLPTLHGADVWTVEGVGRPDALHPVQAALVSEGGSQCGYCTPGFVMSMFALYYRSPRDDIEDALSGNLCRCTGYRPIRAAARALPQVAASDPFALRLQKPRPQLSPLSYRAHAIDFVRPASLQEALRLRAEEPQAQIIAGGTDVVVEVNQVRRRHARFLSLDGVRELRRFELDGDTLVLGSCLTFQDLANEIAAHVPMLAQVLPLFASRLVRARATLGGNLMTASPVGDAAPALLALDAEVELLSLRGSRRLPLEALFIDYRKTALAPDELLSSVRIPRLQPTIARFYKVSKRRLDDISSVSSAMALTLEGGIVTNARLAFGGVAARPLRAHDAEAALVGQAWDSAAVARAQPVLAAAFSPLSDARASAAYRTALVQSLLDKLLDETAP